MTADPAALTELRLQIDAIDTQLHDLLMQRGELAHRIAAAKGGGAPVMRPAREAQVLRRLAGRHHGPFPAGAVVRIWREIMSAMVALQGKFVVAVLQGNSGGGLWETARDHFGTIPSYSAHAAASAVLRAVADGAATAGVLPPPHEGESDAWWPSLANSAPGTPRVIARLPFVQGSGNGERDALVVGRTPVDPSGTDRSLLIVETQDQGSRARLLSRLAAAGFEVGFITTQATGDAAERRHLVEVDGYVGEDDPRCRALIDANRADITQVIAVGAYAVPLDLAGTAAAS